MTSDFNLAVHAAVYLYHHGTICTSRELAASICTNPVRVRRVLSRLKSAGLVAAKEGSGEGGYEFRGSGDTDLAAIARALNIRFTDSAWQSGLGNHECLIASGMPGIMNSIYNDLNEECLKKLRTIHIRDVEETIFPKEKENAK
jgi:DNA-binding IscR family transcriptional regulator